MTKALLTILIGITLLIQPIFLPTVSNAQSTDDSEQKLQDLQKQISDLQTQLDQTKGQEKTLRAQLQYIDTQSQLTELKIAETTEQITKLDHEITDLSGRIDKLSTTVDSMSEVLLNRIIQTYKYGNYALLDLLFSSNGFSDLLIRAKYIEVAQENDKKVLYQLQATKAAYHDQKQDKQQRQQEQEKLKNDLETYKSQLQGEKATKDALLRLTQNNESIYEQKLQQALAEQQAIQAILNGGGTEVSDGQIHQGQVIGYEISGPSACSSGTHLHFEVHQNGSIQDPNNFLPNTSFGYIDNDGGSSEGTISPHGSLSSWPIPNPIEITQGYGMTPVARIGWYGGGPHTGIDMYSPSSLEVRSVHDGQLFHGSITCGGGTLHYKKVDDGDGVFIYYLHVF